MSYSVSHLVNIGIMHGQHSVSCMVNRELGFQAVEVNASETRNKADKGTSGGVAGKMSNRIKELTTNCTIGYGTDRLPREMKKVLCECVGV